MFDDDIPVAGDSGAGETPVPPKPEAEEEGMLESLADGAGEVAKKTGGVLWTMIVKVAKEFYRYLIVIFLPIPVSYLARKQLAFRDYQAEDGKGQLEFYSQPNFVTTIHLIWVGWVVAAFGLYNYMVHGADNIPPFSEKVMDGLSWFWLLVLCVTVLVMGIQFGRVASGFLMTTIVILVMGTLLWEQVGEVEIIKFAKEKAEKIDVTLGWGVPMVVSAVLGFTMLLSSIWQQLDDRWIVAHQGNFLEHENFQQKDRTIQKGAKTFIHTWPCLLRRFLLFGYGEIEVKDSRGITEVERIQGIFWAKSVSELLKSKFQTTDVSLSMQIEEEEEEGLG